MNTPSEKTWKIDESIIYEILSTLSSDFNVAINDPVISKLIFLDDFDFHLWRAGYLLYKNNKQFKLIDPKGRASDITASRNACFCEDFSGDNGVLQKLIGFRALTPVINIEINERKYSLYNEDQKVVVKAWLTQLILQHTTINYLTLRALRGYKESYKQAESSLNGFIKEEINNFGLKTILANNTLQSFNINNNDEVYISADIPAEDAVRKISLSLLNSASLHVGGMIKDTDTEFLHQFRVNFRKLRSLVSLLKKSLPQATAEVLKTKLSLIARKTNKLRDLDVFLLDEKKYRELLPDNFANGLSELYTLIRKQRKEEQKKVAAYFSSESYSNETLACSEVLSLPSVYEASVAAKPVLQVAKKLLSNRYYKILEMSINTNSQSADEDVHAVRIEFKKLRYLIEFFVGLFPKNDINQLVVEIKKIQAVLGNFNDYSTQIGFLKSYVDDEKIEMSKSLSGLIAVLHQRQVEEKRKVTDVLKGFFTEKMNIKIDKIFG